MLSLLAKILFGEPWRRAKTVNVEFPREQRLVDVEIMVHPLMCELTRRVGARTAMRRQRRFLKAHWQLPVPAAMRWDSNKGLVPRQPWKKHYLLSV